METTSESARPYPKLQHHQVTAIWDKGVEGHLAEVEVSVKTDPSGDFNATEGNNPLLEDGNVLVVRAEEALIVVFVLLLWVAAIALFFNRWGKIRMLEPYQPKFQQQHRQSCAMVESQSILPHRTSFSRTCLGDNSLYTTAPNYPLIRPRQNSVFVGSTTTVAFVPGNTPPRKTKSAVDIQSLILAEGIAEEKECRSFSRSHSPTAGFVPGNSLGMSCAGRTPIHLQSHSPILSQSARGNSLGGFGPPGRLGLLGASSTGRIHRNSICMERPSTSRANYLTVTNV